MESVGQGYELAMAGKPEAWLPPLTSPDLGVTVRADVGGTLR